MYVKFDLEYPPIIIGVRPFFNFEKWISVWYLEKINVLDSYCIHGLIIIKYNVKFDLGYTLPIIFWSYGPFSTLKKMVSVWYPLKTLVYWIHI